MSLSMQDLGRLLTAKRGSRGVRAAALDAGVSSSTFSRVENGHIPDLETFAKLCMWLGRDPKEFLGMDVERAEGAAPVAVVHFKKKKTVSPDTAQALGELILAAQAAAHARDRLIGS